MHSMYCVEIGSPLTDEPNDPVRVRCEELGVHGVCVGDPTVGKIGTWPCVVVVGDFTEHQLIPDDQGQATAIDVGFAHQRAEKDEQEAADAKASAFATLTVHKATLEHWLVANPSGAALTPAQTLLVADALRSVLEILIAELGSQ